MRNSWIFYQKEMLESFRSFKLIWIPVVFIILGIMQPLTLYYMADIMKAAGNIPPELLAGFELPDAATVMVQSLGQYGTIGLLVLALATMNSLAGERSGGTAEMMLVRPLTPTAMTAAKWCAQFTLLLLALGLGAAGAAYYTAELFGPLNWGRVAAASALYGLWLLCVVSLTLLFSAFLRPAVAAFLSLLSAAGLSLAFSLLPSRLDWTPAALPALSASVLTEGESVAASPLISAALLILLCIGGAAQLAGRNKLPKE